MIVINMILTVILLCFFLSIYPSILNILTISAFLNHNSTFRKCQMVIFVGYETFDETNF
jgi:hypothetical protein